MLLPKRGFYHPVAILVLAAITLSVAIIFYLNSNVLFKAPKPTQSSSPAGSPSPTPLKSPVNENITNWKSYSSSKDGYTIKYPANWYFYDDTNSPCPNYYSIIIVKPENGPVEDCTYGDWRPSAFYLIVSKQTELPTSNEYDTYTEVIIDGRSGVKNVMTETSELPRHPDTRIYVNNNGKNYYFSFPNTDLKGSHEAIYDEIIQSFKFLD